MGSTRDFRKHALQKHLSSMTAYMLCVRNQKSQLTSPLLMPLTCSSTAGPTESSAFFTCTIHPWFIACLTHMQPGDEAAFTSALLMTQRLPEATRLY